MATKLKNLRISKVDFVDEGANPDAHIKLTKSKGEKGQSTGENGDKNGFVSRLFGFIGKKAGMNQEEIDSAVEEVLKGNSVSFNERFNEIKNRKIADEIWDICYALQASLCSILNDEELDSTGAATAMNESLDEFTAVVKKAISNWSGGKVINIVTYAPVSSEVPTSTPQTGPISVNVAVSPNFQIEAKEGQSEEDIVAVIRRHLGEIADELGGNIADKLSEVFANMPVSSTKGA